jgi:hypothetical protein
MEVAPTVGQNYAFYLLGKLEDCSDAGESFQILFNRSVQSDETGKIVNAKIINSPEARAVLSIWFGKLAALYRLLAAKVEGCDKKDLKEEFAKFRTYAFHSYLLYEDPDKAFEMQFMLGKAIEVVTKITEFEKS